MNSHTKLSSIDILLILIVLCILGMVLSPAISEASIPSKTSVLIERLQKMRSFLDLYKVHHNDRFPSSESFESAMAEDVGGHGRYLRKVPANPFNGLDTIRFDGAPAGTGEAGWHLDTCTGYFQADNDTAYASL